ncbi:MAG: amino acid--tRNA ligase-related protein, partial [Anaerococcus sp.]|nr:OB-fold nucleic acid binding domain-containing protein [Peptoniphilaceae bacterium]MDY3054775.1 amino acid--tRNA ligase-related protein [Anaerococcus sp.]
MKLRDIRKDVDKYVDQEVTIQGWVRQARFGKNVGFLEVNDGSIFKNIQVVVGKDIENYEDLSKIYLSTSLKVVGVLVKTNNAKQAYEIQAKSIEILGESSEKFPIQKQRQTFEYLRTIPHLRPRTNTYRAVFRVRSVLAYSIHKFFQDKGFVYTHSPIVTASDTEGAGEMFQVTTMDLNKPEKNEDGTINYKKDFFSKKAYLTVSGQLEAEDQALAFSDVYTFGPTFRAEMSNTPRHAAEFWMIEPELAFADYNVCMDVAEEMVKYMIDF